MQVNPKLDQKKCVCWTSVVELSQAWVLVKDLRDVNLFQGGVEKGGAALLLEKGVRTARRNLEVSRKLIHGEGGRCCAGTCAGTRIFPSLARYNTKRTGVRVLIPVLSRPVAAKKTRVPNPNGWSEHVRKAEQDKLLHNFKKKQKKKNFSFSFSFFYFLCGMCAYFAIFFKIPQISSTYSPCTFSDNGLGHNLSGGESSIARTCLAGSCGHLCFGSKLPLLLPCEHLYV